MEIGKWYKFKSYKPNGSDTIGKVTYINLSKDEVTCDPWIHMGVFYQSGTWFFEDIFNSEELEVTSNEIQQHLPEDHPDKIFVLPEKWCVRWECRENYEIINKYFNTIGKNYHYENDRIHQNAIVCSDGTYINKINSNVSAINPPNEYTLLTFEQFERYVLKKETKTIPEDMSYLKELLNKLNTS